MADVLGFMLILAICLVALASIRRPDRIVTDADYPGLGCGGCLLTFLAIIVGLIVLIALGYAFITGIL